VRRPDLPRADLVLLAICGVAAAALLVVGLFAVFYRWELLGVASEYINVFHASQLGDGNDLYRELGPDVWSFPVYFPGLYVLMAPLTWVSGGDAVWLERLAALAGLVGVGWLAWWTAGRLGATRAFALLSGLVLATFIPVTFISGVVRPDVFALLMAAGALAAVTRWEDEGGARWLFMAAALCAGVVLTRQVYAPIPAALIVAVFLWDRRAAVAMAVCAGAALAAGLGLAQVLSDGAFRDDQQAFTQFFALGSLREVIVSQLVVPNPAYFVAAAGCWVHFVRRRDARAAHLAWLGAGVSCLAAVKVGSSGNYFLPLMFTSAVLFGPTLQEARSALSPRRIRQLWVVTAILLLPGALFASYTAVSSVVTASDLSSEYESAVDRIETVDGRVLGDRFDLLLAADRTPDFEPLLVSQMIDTGEQSFGPLLEGVRDGRFELIQTSFDLDDDVPGYNGLTFWPQSVADEMKASYCEAWSDDHVWLYEPCPARERDA
jgi:hypothetical protein